MLPAISSQRRRDVGCATATVATDANVVTMSPDVALLAGQVRIAVSEPQGGVDKCHVHALGQGEGPLVRFPTIQDGPASSAEDRSITKSAGDSDRSTATGSIMVPRADGPIPSSVGNSRRPVGPRPTTFA